MGSNEMRDVASSLRPDAAAMLAILQNSSLQASRLRAELASQEAVLHTAGGPWDPSSELSGERRISPVEERELTPIQLDSALKAANGNVASMIGKEHDSAAIEAAAASLLSNLDRQLSLDQHQQDEGAAGVSSANNQFWSQGGQGRPSEVTAGAVAAAAAGGVSGLTSVQDGMTYYSGRGDGSAHVERDDEAQSSREWVGVVRGGQAAVLRPRLPGPADRQLPRVGLRTATAATAAIATARPAVVAPNGRGGSFAADTSLRGRQGAVAAGAAAPSEAAAAPSRAHTRTRSGSDGLEGAPAWECATPYEEQTHSPEQPGSQEQQQHSGGGGSGRRAALAGHDATAAAAGHLEPSAQSETAVLMGSPLSSRMRRPQVSPRGSSCASTSQPQAQTQSTTTASGSASGRGSRAPLPAPRAPVVRPPATMGAAAGGKQAVGKADGRPAMPGPSGSSGLVSKMDILARLKKANEAFNKTHPGKETFVAGPGAAASAPLKQQQDRPPQSLRYLDILSHGRPRGGPNSSSHPHAPSSPRPPARTAFTPRSPAIPARLGAAPEQQQQQQLQQLGDTGQTELVATRPAAPSVAAAAAPPPALNLLSQVQLMLASMEAGDEAGAGAAGAGLPPRRFTGEPSEPAAGYVVVTRSGPESKEASGAGTAGAAAMKPFDAEDAGQRWRTGSSGGLVAAAKGGKLSSVVTVMELLHGSGTQQQQGAPGEVALGAMQALGGSIGGMEAAREAVPQLPDPVWQAVSPRRTDAESGPGYGAGAAQQPSLQGLGIKVSGQAASQYDSPAKQPPPPKRQMQQQQPSERQARSPGPCPLALAPTRTPAAAAAAAGAARWRSVSPGAKDAAAAADAGARTRSASARMATWGPTRHGARANVQPARVWGQAARPAGAAAGRPTASASKAVAGAAAKDAGFKGRPEAAPKVKQTAGSGTGAGGGVAGGVCPSPWVMHQLEGRGNGKQWRSSEARDGAAAAAPAPVAGAGAKRGEGRQDPARQQSQQRGGGKASVQGRGGATVGGRGSHQQAVATARTATHGAAAAAARSPSSRRRQSRSRSRSHSRGTSAQRSPAAAAMGTSLAAEQSEVGGRHGSHSPLGAVRASGLAEPAAYSSDGDSVPPSPWAINWTPRSNSLGRADAALATASASQHDVPPAVAGVSAAAVAGAQHREHGSGGLGAAEVGLDGAAGGRALCFVQAADEEDQDCVVMSRFHLRGDHACGRTESGVSQGLGSGPGAGLEGQEQQLQAGAAGAAGGARQAGGGSGCSDAKTHGQRGLSLNGSSPTADEGHSNVLARQLAALPPHRGSAPGGLQQQLVAAGSAVAQASERVQEQQEQQRQRQWAHVSAGGTEAGRLQLRAAPEADQADVMQAPASEAAVVRDARTRTRTGEESDFAVHLQTLSLVNQWLMHSADHVGGGEEDGERSGGWVEIRAPREDEEEVEPWPREGEEEEEGDEGGVGHGSLSSAAAAAMLAAAPAVSVAEGSDATLFVAAVSHAGANRPASVPPAGLRGRRRAPPPLPSSSASGTAARRATVTAGGRSEASLDREMRELEDELGLASVERAAARTVLAAASRRPPPHHGARRRGLPPLPTDASGSTLPQQQHHEEAPLDGASSVALSVGEELTTPEARPGVASVAQRAGSAPLRTSPAASCSPPTLSLDGPPATAAAAFAAAVASGAEGSSPASATPSSPSAATALPQPTPPSRMQQWRSGRQAQSPASPAGASSPFSPSKHRMPASPAPNSAQKAAPQQMRPPLCLPLSPGPSPGPSPAAAANQRASSGYGYAKRLLTHAMLRNQASATAAAAAAAAAAAGSEDGGSVHSRALPSVAPSRALSRATEQEPGGSGRPSPRYREGLEARGGSWARGRGRTAAAAGWRRRSKATRWRWRWRRRRRCRARAAAWATAGSCLGAWRAWAEVWSIRRREAWAWVATRAWVWVGRETWKGGGWSLCWAAASR